MKLRFGLAAALAGVSMAAGSPALAQDESSAGSVYLRIGGGVSFSNDMDQSVGPNPNAVVCFALSCMRDRQIVDFDKSYVAGAALGFDYADGIRTELEYRYVSAEVDTVTAFAGTAEGVISTPEDKAVIQFLMSNFYFDFNNSSPLTPFIGGGVGGAFMKNEQAQRDAALAYQGRAGVSYALGGGFLADVEYVYTRTKDFVFDEDGSGATFVPSLSGDRYEASSVMMSLRKNF